MQEDEVSNEEFDSFEEEQKQRRCKIIAVCAVVLVVAAGIIACVCLKPKSSGGGKSASAEAGPSYTSDDNANATNATAGLNIGDMWKDMDTVDDSLVKKADVKATNVWKSQFQKGTNILKAAETWLNSFDNQKEFYYQGPNGSDDLLFMHSLNGNDAKKKDAKCLILSSIKLMIQACPNWSDLPDYIATQVYGIAAPSVRTSIYYDSRVNVTAAPGTGDLKAIDGSANTSTTPESKRGSWVVGKRGKADLNMHLLNNFCQHDQIAHMSYSAGSFTNNYVYYAPSGALVNAKNMLTESANGKKQMASAEEDIKGAVSGFGHVACYCENAALGYLAIDDALEVIDGTIEYMSIMDKKTSEGNTASIGYQLMAGLDDNAIAQNMRNIETLKAKQQRLTYIKSSCPDYQASMTRVKKAQNELLKRGMLMFDVNNTQMTAKAADKQSSDMTHANLAAQIMHNGVFKASIPNYYIAQQNYWGFNVDEALKVLTNNRAGVSTGAFLEVGSNWQVNGMSAGIKNGVAEINGVRSAAGVQSFMGLAYSIAGEDHELAKFKNQMYNVNTIGTVLGYWYEKKLEWASVESFWGLATMTSGMNAVCQLRYLEDNIYMLKDKYVALTEKKNMIEAIKGNPGLTPWLLSTERMGPFESNDRAQIISRMFGLGANNPQVMTSNAQLFTKMVKMIEEADLWKAFGGVVTEYVDLVQDLSHDKNKEVLVMGKGNGQWTAKWKGELDAELSERAFISLRMKWFEKIRAVTYIVDKFVHYNVVKTAKKEMIDEIEGDLKKEMRESNKNWRDVLAGKGAETKASLSAQLAVLSQMFGYTPMASTGLTPDTMFGTVKNMNASVRKAAAGEYLAASRFAAGQINSIQR